MNDREAERPLTSYASEPGGRIWSSEMDHNSGIGEQKEGASDRHDAAVAWGALACGRRGQSQSGWKGAHARN